MKTFLYVEEFENALADALVERTDIQLILLRFSNCLKFSQTHLKKTKGIATFMIDKLKPFDMVCTELKAFLNETCRNIDVFYNDSEYNQVFVQRLARTLSLPGALSKKQADVVRDKICMKEFLKGHSIPCAEYMLLSKPEDVRNCAERWGYPLIVKWRASVSSIQVYKIHSYADFLDLHLDLSTNRYMAEQYIPDKIWCVDALVASGLVVQNLYTWLPFTNLDFAENKSCFCQIATSRPPETFRFDGRALSQSIISTLGLQSGYLHLEVFVSQEGFPFVCEFGWRTPGDHMLQNFSHVFQRSVEDALIDILLGLPFEPFAETDVCTADVFLPMKTGRVRRISSIGDLKETCNIIDGQIRYQCGNVLTSRHAYTDSSGWVQVSAAGIPAVLKEIDIIYQTFVLEVDNDL